MRIYAVETVISF